MTETPGDLSQPQPQPQWTSPPAGPPPLPPSAGPPPPPPPSRPPRIRRGTLAVLAAATLAAGALGGTVGSWVGAPESGNSAQASTSTSAQPVSATQPTDITSVVNKVLPSVVQVNVTAGNQQGIGSGVILSQDGKILTNNHVVSGADKLTVTLSDGRTVDASVVRTDPTNDLAVIQAKGVSGLTAATLGDSGGVLVGDAVIAIGSPGGLQGTVTTGIVSALNREVTVSDQQQSPFPFSRNGAGATVTYHAIQTDASINQGNSGGPLFNSAGEVIGINSAIYSPVSSPGGAAGSVGIGFSIPINSAKGVIG
jgi:putative serine protease PepD